MDQLKQSENPVSSKGALIFAFNGKYDYVYFASQNAKLISKHLQLPTTLVTDTNTYLPRYEDVFDKIIVVKVDEGTNFRKFKYETQSEVINWKNNSRFDAYDMSPYDTTMLIDADYIVASDFLNQCLDIDSDIVAFKKAYDISTGAYMVADEFINFNSLEMYWATVVVFKKSQLAKETFDLMREIKKNWAFYRSMYSFKSPTYRNDFAFTIAAHMLFGQTASFTGIPAALATASTDVSIDAYHGDRAAFRCSQAIPGTGRKVYSHYGDLHVMNKACLTESIYSNLLK